MNKITIRVISHSEQISTLFSTYMFSHLSKIQNRAIKPLLITNNKTISSLNHLQLRDISWDKAISEVEKTIHEGYNTLILSDLYVDWDTHSSSMNTKLDEFQNMLLENKINVLCVEQYSIENIEKKLYQFSYFNENNWIRINLSEILKIMQENYRDEMLISPVGVLPYFQLKPNVSSKWSKNVKNFVGFQPWSYESLPIEMRNVEFPFLHNAATINRKKYNNCGPIPIEISIDNISS